MNIYKQIFKQIKKYDTIVIARHIGADPDALGSQFALKNIILELFPDKKYILKLPYGEDIDWTTIDNFNKLCNLEVALMSLNDINRCKEHNIKFFWGYEIISYYDLKRLVDLGVSQVLLRHRYIW